MLQSGKKVSIIRHKLIYTILILLVYFLGKSLPLYGVDVSSFIDRGVDAEALLTQTISGDIYQCSLFALGISPYMMSSIFVQIAVSFRSSESKARISPKKKNRMILAMTVVLAVFQAFSRVQELPFMETGGLLLLAKSVAMAQMTAGVILILWLSVRNKKYGIGGQTALIFVNILDGMTATLKGHAVRSLIAPVIVSLAVILIMLVMENAEKRIPVQRISIHNIYADKNYMAIKLNPIGVMPAMFSMAFFMLPQMIFSGLSWLMPGNVEVAWWQQNMSLSRPLGVAVYIFILYCLTIGFSRVFINPKEITEQFLKSGDSILNLHAGRDTKRYLSREIGRISFLSATVMSICLGIPMVLQFVGGMDSTLVMFPSSVMMMTGIWCNLYREVAAIRDLEAYRPFI